MAVCAFLGLGVMGFPMAGHLRSKGHDVRVWNRTQATADRWEKQYGAGAKVTAAEAAAEADFVMLCVGADKDVLAV
ncbi:MAG: NAD(P)-binding domain-containing protein, partial [Pseudomonadota bacterium]